MPTIVLEMERLRNPYSGLGQYCLHLGRAFAALAAEPWQSGAVASLDFACLVPADRMGEFGDGMTYKAVKPWYKIIGPSFGESLWHCMHQDAAFLPRSRNTPLIYTIHDLNFMDRPDYSEAKIQRCLAEIQQKLNRAKGLVYISEYVRQWVQEHLKVPAGTEERVIYNGGAMDLELSTYGLRPTSDDLQFTTDELRLRSGEIPAEVENIQSKALSHVESRKSTLESRHSQVRSHKSQIGNPFLFSIGIHPKKNYHVLMPLLAENKQYKWIIAGPDSRGYKGKIEQEAAKFGLSDRIEFCGPVDDKEKLEYYQNCTALLFPSLSEGFGLPVVEAMSIGKPVFLSNRTSLPEIGGSEAYYFKDFEPKTLNETFTSGMKNFENDPEKPQRMKTWATQFTWEKAAKQYIEFYQDLLKVHH